jgi:hypothetical protein
MVETRQSNTDKHPGAIVAPTPRRSSAQVQAEKKEAQEIKVATATEKRANILAAAKAETVIREQENVERTQVAHPPIMIKVKARPTPKKANAEEDWENYVAPMSGRGKGSGRGRGRGRGRAARDKGAEDSTRGLRRPVKTRKPGKALVTPETIEEALVSFLFRLGN